MDNVLLIGNKPLHSYVLACITRFKTNQGSNVLTLKARGRAINRCVDVAEVITKKLMLNKITIADIRINTEEILSETGKKNKVSTMEIDLKDIFPLH